MINNVPLCYVNIEVPRNHEIESLFSGAAQKWVSGACATPKKREQEINGIVKAVLVIEDIFESVMIFLLILTNLLILVYFMLNRTGYPKLEN